MSDQLLWDAPDIRLTNKQHLRMATYIFKVRHVLQKHSLQAS